MHQVPIQRTHQFIPNPIDSIRTSSREMPIINIYQKIPNHRLLSTLKSISRNIDSPMSVWTNPHFQRKQQSQHERETVDVMRSILQQVSGGNVITFLSAMLSESEQIQLHAVRPIMQSVNEFVNNDDNKAQRQSAMQFLSPHISFDSLRQIGFDQKHKNIHRHSRASYKQNGRIILSNDCTKRGPKSKIKSPLIRMDVYNHCLSHSDYMHEQILKRKSKKQKRIVCAKRIRTPKKRLFKLYPNRFNIKYTSFRKIFHQIGEFKKCKKRTDLCQLCCDSKQAKKTLNQYINILNEGIEENPDCIPLIDDLAELSNDELNDLFDAMQASESLSPTEKEVAVNKIDLLRIFITHLPAVTERRTAYIHHITHIKRNECRRCVDWKQKIPTGHKYEEESYVFRNLKLRNCLGVSLHFYDEIYIFDVITNITNQTSLLSKCILNYIMDHPAVITKFRKERINTLDTWYDTESHFRNRSVLHHDLCQIPQNPNYADLEHIGYHLHTPCHGKSYVDGHFCFVSAAVEQQGLTEKGVQCTEDIVTAIETAAEQRADSQRKITYFPINFDIKGPLKDSKYIKPLRAEVPKEEVLQVSQLKAYNHYIYKRSEQELALNTEREVDAGDDQQHIISLPSLRTERMADIGKVMINTKYLPSSQPLKRWHLTKIKNATKPKTAETIKAPELSLNEYKRQQSVRQRLSNEANTNDIDIDMALSEDVDDEQCQCDMDSESDGDDNDRNTKSRAALQKMTVTQLKALCKARGLHRYGRKNQIITRVLNHQDSDHKPERLRNK